MFGRRKSAPINTEQLARLDPSMQTWVRGGNPSAIETQEAGGQKLFVNSDTLPVSHRNDYDDLNSQQVLEAAGVKFGELVAGDPLFQYVELPEGWKKVPTSHSMWSDLVDEKGRKRASIFYKAAFYDRDAFYGATRRYSVSFDYERQECDGVGVSNVMDGETIIHTTEPIQAKDGQRRFGLSEQANTAAKAWLDEHYPDWKCRSNWD